jgi:hypothetical protein
MTKDEQLALARERAAEVNKGNQHSSKINRILNETLKRRLIQEEALKANLIVEALLNKAEEGDISAIKEVFDRMEGKAVARQEITGADGEALPLSIGISFVKPDSEVSK